MARPAVLFRLDANPQTGLGHLSRCLNLGEEFHRRGRVTYFSGEFNSDAMERIVSAGGEILPPPPVKVASTPDLDGEQLLLHHALEKTGARILITDSYNLPPGYHNAARELFPVVAMIDDLNPAPPEAHVVINYNLYAPRLGYRPAFPDTRLLLGPAYALLSPAIRNLSKKVIRPQVHRILVTMGGSDPEGLTVKVLNALQMAGVGEVWDVVMGPGFTTCHQLKQLASIERRVQLHFAPTSLLPLLLQSDLVVCAGGVTSCEAVATGTPVLIILVAENQRPNAEEMASRGIAVHLGWGKDVAEETIAGQITGLAGDLERRLRMSESGRVLYDGYGPNRCVDAILELEG